MTEEALRLVESALDSGIFSIEEMDDDTFTIFDGDGNVYDDGYESEDAAKEYLATTIY